jgi:hypothetical protein
VTDLAEIFRAHGPAYREKFGSRMPESHLRAMLAIESCRTQALGGHVFFCQPCGDLHFSNHSCQNRHCPKCQSDQASHWLEKQTALLLPIPHFLLTFTVPEELRLLTRSNQKLFLNILFRSSAEALQQLCRDPRFLGAQIGMVGALHTWTRALVYHPHVHYVVPGGGLAEESWVSPRSAGFLVAVKALSVLFRAKFRDALEKEAPALFSSILTPTWSRAWVVHCKPVGTGEHALGYLARYVFRVAISNNRILSLQNGIVTFDYKDAETKQRTICHLIAEEFIRRFLQHVLPTGFIKVRYYGLFAPTKRPLLNKARAVLPAIALVSLAPKPPERKSPSTCPKCGHPMTLVATFGRSPP